MAVLCALCCQHCCVIIILAHTTLTVLIFCSIWFHNQKSIVSNSSVLELLLFATIFVICFLNFQPSPLWVLSGEKISQKTSQEKTPAWPFVQSNLSSLAPHLKCVKIGSIVNLANTIVNLIYQTGFTYWNFWGKEVQILSDMTLCLSLESPSTIEEFTTTQQTRYTRA